MSEANIEGVLNATLEKLKTLVDVNTIIGEQIVTPDGTVIIPVSKVTFGFASGGSDLPTAKPKDLFGGGSGAGVTIQPLAFLIISPTTGVRLMQMEQYSNSVDRAVKMMPDVIDQVVGLFHKPKAGPTPEEMP